jgi:zinc transport system permease protein
MESILSSLLAYLSSGFIQRAFVIGIIIAVLSSMLSVYIVLKRLSLIGDGLAHTAYGGIAVGLAVGSIFPSLSGVNPYFVGGAIVIVGSLMITKVIRSARLAGDAAVAVFLELGLASGIFITSITLNYGFALDSLLFGSILLVTWQQIFIAGGVTLFAGGFLVLFYKELLYTVFDEVQARAAGISTWRYDYLLAVVAGIAVVVSIPIVGILLISALLVLPALTSMQLSRSFRQTILLAPVFGVASVVLGLLLSILMPHAAPGGAIVLVALSLLLLVLVTKRAVSFISQ